MWLILKQDEADLDAKRKELADERLAEKTAKHHKTKMNEGKPLGPVQSQ